MLGRFLEWSIVTPDIRSSLDFYRRLGFAEAAVGEAWTHPYAVMTDGRIFLGLHEKDSFQSSITFVKPGVLRQVDDLERMGLEFAFRRLGADVFNEVGWLDPSGQLIRLVEARTFSPIERRSTETSLCGYFIEIALPAPSFDQAKSHWEQFGFVGMDEQEDMLPHLSCTSDTIDVGFYEPAHVRGPTLRFEVADVEATVARLTAIGILPSGRVPTPLKHSPAAALTAPEGTAILLTGPSEDRFSMNLARPA